jgi:hypothetical protein
MARLQIPSVVFLVLTLTLSCEAKKKSCSEVICPDFEFNSNQTVTDINKYYFENEKLPENGICLDGKLRHIFDGDTRGFPGTKRCLCFPKNFPHTLIEHPRTCAAEDVQCPVTPPTYKGELFEDRWIRLGKTYIQQGITEGCCPAGSVQLFLNPLFSKVDKTLCFCHPLESQLIILEGLPKEHSLSSSSEETHKKVQ